jgi:hypothetical protein
LEYGFFIGALKMRYVKNFIDRKSRNFLDLALNLQNFYKRLFK